MTVEQVKCELKKHIGENVIIEYHLGRNKIESYQVTIKELYNYVFLVESSIKKDIKSFSYSDVITKIVRIRY